MFDQWKFKPQYDTKAYLHEKDIQYQVWGKKNGLGTGMVSSTSCFPSVSILHSYATHSSHSRHLEVEL